MTKAEYTFEKYAASKSDTNTDIKRLGATAGLLAGAGGLGYLGHKFHDGSKMHRIYDIYDKVKNTNPKRVEKLLKMEKKLNRLGAAAKIGGAALALASLVPAKRFLFND